MVPLAAAAFATLPNEWDAASRALTSFGVAAAGWMLLAVPAVLVGRWPVSLAAIAALAFGVRIALGRGRRRTRRPALVDDGTTLSRWIESAAVIGSVATPAAILLGPWAARTAGGRLGVLLSGEDNAAHLGLIVGIREAKGYLWRSTDPAVAPGLLQYPQGLHLMIADAADALGIGSDPRSAIGLYGFAFCVAVSLAIGATCVAALRLARALGADGASAPVAAGVVVLVGLNGPLLFQMQNGFLAQIGAWVLLMLLVAVCVDPALRRRPFRQLLLGCSLVAGIAASYYFFLPSAVAVLAGSTVPSIRVLISRPRALVLAAVPLFLGAIPVLFSLQSGAAGYVVAPGAIFTIDRAVLLTLLLPLPLVLSGFPARRNLMTLPWLLGAAASILLSAGLLWRAGTGSYYFEKSLYGLFIFGVIGAAAALPTVLPHDSGGLARAMRGPVIGLATAVLVILHLGRPSPTLTHQLRASMADQTLEQALRPDRRSEAPIFWRFRSPTEDFIVTKTLGAAYHAESDQRRALEMRLVLSGATEDAALRAFVAERPSRIFTSDAALASLIGGDSEVIVVDLDG